MNIRHVKGSFVIEMLFVLLILIGTFYFMTDASHKLILRSKLDSISFSLVSILKDRTRFFDERAAINNSDFNDMEQLASRLLNEDISQFGIRVESLTEGSALVTLSDSEFTSLGCNSETLDNKTTLVPEEEGTLYPLYQISICLQSDSWFARAWGTSSSTNVTITSSSVMAGR